MQLWCVPACTGGLCKRERFCEHGETCCWLSEGPLGVGEECQIIRAHNLASCRPKSAQTVGELLRPFLRPSLVRERPAVPHRTDCDPERQPLVCGKADGGVRTLVDGMHPMMK